MDEVERLKRRRRADADRRFAKRLQRQSELSVGHTAHLRLHEGKPLLYDQMCAAIAACVEVDDVKDIRSKAIALDAYYKQAGNFEAERNATKIRLRAEHRLGELLKELTKTEATARSPGRAGISGGARRKLSPYAAALNRHGIPERDARRFQELADVPADEFEAALEDPMVPLHAASIINRGKPKEPKPAPTCTVSDESLTLWGTLCELERYGGLLAADYKWSFDKMTAPMLADLRRLAPLTVAFAQALIAALDAHATEHARGLE